MPATQGQEGEGEREGEFSLEWEYREFFTFEKLIQMPHEIIFPIYRPPSLCFTLQVSDVGLIAPSIGKMQAALALLPRLEKFARSVCDLVLAPLVDNNENSGQHQTAGSAQPRRAMEDALPVRKENISTCALRLK